MPLKAKERMIEIDSRRLYEKWSLEVCQHELTTIQEQIHMLRLRINVLQSIINEKKDNL